MAYTRRDFIRSSSSAMAGLFTVPLASHLLPQNSATARPSTPLFTATLADEANRKASLDRKAGTHKTGFPIVDTHTHFYDPTRPEGVPWPAKNDAVLYRPVLPREFESLTKPLGVTGTIIVEASPWVEDNQWLLDLATNHPFILGIVGNLSPGTALFAKELARFSRNSLYRGIRIGSSQVKAGLDRPEFLLDLQRLVDADLELDVNGGPETLMLVDRLAGRIPELRIVINHLSNIKIDGKQPPAEWLGGLKAAASHSQVFLKVSALIESARTDAEKAPQATEFYHPVLQAAWQAFGEDKLIYGSNWPVSELAGPYELVLQIVTDFFQNQSLSAREKFFAKNASIAYAWKPRR